MAVVYVTDERKADICVYMVDKEYKADLLVCEVDREMKAKGDALWYYLQKKKVKQVLAFAG